MAPYESHIRQMCTFSLILCSTADDLIFFVSLYHFLPQSLHLLRILSNSVVVGGSSWKGMEYFIWQSS